MTQLPPDFKEFLRLLNSEKVEYLVVGGYAVGHHGFPRVTGDMDVWVAATPENARRVVGALKKFGFSYAGKVAPILVQEKQVVRLGVPPVRIEIITTITGVEFKDCYAQRTIATLDEGIEVSLIGLSELKLNKAATGRPKDLDDLKHLP